MSRWPRLVRLAPHLALAAVLAAPVPALAAPPDRGEAEGAAAPRTWLASLWQPLARLFGAGGDETPTMGPEGLTEGPGMDPGGLVVGQTMDRDGAGADLAPTMDPDGATQSSGAEGDEGPTMDPDG